ncbi:unnamed protein product, partial [Ceratitis capitata]
MEMLVGGSATYLHIYSFIQSTHWYRTSVDANYTECAQGVVSTDYVHIVSSSVATQHAYRRKYRDRAAPKSDIIRRLASNFETHITHMNT